MAHPNRRSDDPDDGKRHIVQNAVESTFAKVLARYGVPVLLGWMAWQGREALGEQKLQSADIAQVKSDLRVMSLRFDEVGLAQIKSNANRIDLVEKKDIDQDRRLDALERTVKTP